MKETREVVAERVTRSYNDEMTGVTLEVSVSVSDHWPERLEAISISGSGRKIELDPQGMYRLLEGIDNIIGAISNS